MTGRVRRKRGLAAADAASARETERQICPLCRRALGRRIEWHHPIPKSMGGRETVPLHPICHRTLHATFDHAALARFGMDFEGLRGDPAIAAFLRWIADKPADFHAPTHRRAARR